MKPVPSVLTIKLLFAKDNAEFAYIPKLVFEPSLTIQIILLRIVSSPKVPEAGKKSNVSGLVGLIITAPVASVVPERFFQANKSTFSNVVGFIESYLVSNNKLDDEGSLMKA